MGTAAQDRLVLGVDLRDAIANNELFLEYQPTFDLGKSVLSGVEALVQWRHPTRGLIASEQLLLIAEEAGMIVAINRFALAESCRQSAAWSRQGRAIPISLRISEDQLLSDELAAEVEQALRGNGMSPDLLTLEVAELVLMEDPDRAVDRLRRLKELGLRITVDDFGTGYFSQTYSLRFPFDALKIDRKFTANIASSKRAQSLTQAFVDLGVTLGLSTFADSIDDHAQLGEVQRRYCDHGRGYYSTHPLSPAEIEDLFAAEGGLGSDPSHSTDSGGHSCVPAKSTAG
jgi:EAL domain-containing protein (putative c-di-GMP-specific phosphodiesterase class I)